MFKSKLNILNALNTYLLDIEDINKVFNTINNQFNLN